jgi:hypothetical protein
MAARSRKFLRRHRAECAGALKARPQIQPNREQTPNIVPGVNGSEKPRFFRRIVNFARNVELMGRQSISGLLSGGPSLYAWELLRRGRVRSPGRKRRGRKGPGRRPGSGMRPDEKEKVGMRGGSPFARSYCRVCCPGDHRIRKL